jgi:FKBP-type peptidyl-prolyl cis-trans isomerase FkpA
MHARLVSALAGALALACAGTAPTRRDVADLPRAEPGVLYAIGASFGAQVKDYRLSEDEALEVERGMLDSALQRPYAGVLTDDTADQVRVFHETRTKALAGREAAQGAPLLEAALRAPGAVKTESGIVLQVIERGSGPSPTIFDYVTINYHGTLRDGTVFYSNRGKAPERQQLGTTTRCWQEALGAVAAGARLHVVCPPEVSYGWGGWPGLVPGGAVLTYDLELISIEPTPPPPNWKG